MEQGRTIVFTRTESRARALALLFAVHSRDFAVGTCPRAASAGALEKGAHAREAAKEIAR